MVQEKRAIRNATLSLYLPPCTAQAKHDEQTALLTKTLERTDVSRSAGQG